MRLRACLLVMGVGCGDAPGRVPDGPDDDGDGIVAGEDCDDASPTVHPGADELCNQIDDDCDLDVDEDAVDAVAVFTDTDADGYGAAEAGTACAPAPDQSAEGGDCDDLDPGVHPGATEFCNGGIDDDCDGAVDDDDDAIGTTAWYADFDLDGYGGGVPIVACDAPAGAVSNGADCDDLDAQVHPGAEEVCNGIDDDCDPFSSETGFVTVEGVQYWSIQDGIDAAPDGGTVGICDGTWFENLRVDRDIVLEGMGADVSIVDGSEAGPVVSVAPGFVLTVRRLTLQHGVGEVEAGFGSSNTIGGAIQAYRANALVVESSAIRSSTAQTGAGIMGPGRGDVTLLDTIVSDNTAENTGGGAYLPVEGVSAIDIQDCEFTGNTSGSDGGGFTIYATGFNVGATATITDSLLDGNVVGPDRHGCGGAFWSYHPGLTLHGVTISNNVAPDGGGACTWDNATADDKTEIVDNATYEGGHGGGIFALAGFWRYGHVEGNTAAYGGGVVLQVGEGRDLVVEGNHAFRAGGGVWLDYGAALRDSQVSGNDSADVGGGLYVTYYTDVAASAAGCVVDGNVATNGGGGAMLEGNFESESTDWGTGATDNTPDDVLFLYADGEDPIPYSDFAGAEDFVCDLEEATCE
jgi:hypothetical protein